jgi:hypothetical protein
MNWITYFSKAFKTLASARDEYSKGNYSSAVSMASNWLSKFNLQFDVDMFDDDDDRGVVEYCRDFSRIIEDAVVYGLLRGGGKIASDRSAEKVSHQRIISRIMAFSISRVLWRK